jgi:hypothetical protein
MMEVCMEFKLKRETYHFAVNFVDRYLSVVPGIKKVQLQLIGVACLFISAKMEEILSPKVADFSNSTDNGYSAKEIVAKEKEILTALKWLTTPPTLNMWAQWYMTQWDLFIQEQGGPLFKSPEQNSYAMF